MGVAGGGCGGMASATFGIAVAGLIAATSAVAHSAATVWPVGQALGLAKL